MKTKLSHWLYKDSVLYCLLFVVYAILAIGLTYPAVKGVLLPHTMPGYGDVVQFQYFYWWFKYALLDLGTNPQVATLIYYPVGGLWIFATLFNEITSAFLQLVMSVSQAYTLLWLFTFPATALTTFALAHYITKSRPAAFLAGIIFAFSTYRYAHGLGHMGLFTTQWLPLYVYALLRSRDLPNVRNGILLIIAVLLAGLSEFPYYLFYFMGLFLLCFFVYGIWTHDRRIWNVRFVVSVALAFGILGLALGVAYSNILFAGNAEYLNRTGTFWLSADLLGFLLPSQWHPLWGDLYAAPGSIGRYGLDIVEHSQYVGFVSLVLAALGLWKSHLRDKRLWAFVIVVAFVLALGPALKVGGQVVIHAPREGQTSLIPLPYWAIMNLPFVSRLRAPSRHFVLMQLAIAVTSAAGWTFVEKKIERFKVLRIGTIGLLSAVILFESLFMFPYAMTTVPISKVYDQLAQENLAGGILELPMALDREAPEGRWYLNLFLRMYEATIHHHPIVGGLAGRPDPEVIVFNETTPYIREMLGGARVWRQNIEDPFHQDWAVLERVGPSILQSDNIDYVILHINMLSKGEFAFLNEAISRQSGVPFFDDGTVVAYRIVADPSVEWPMTDRLAVIAGQGWYLPLWNGAKVVRRMVGNGEIVILSPERQTVHLILDLNSRPGTASLIQMSANGHPLETAVVPEEGMTLLTHPFQLEKGYNVVSLEKVGDSEYMGIAADMMQFDVEVSRLKIVPVDTVQLVSQSLVAQLGQSIELVGVDWEVGGGDMAQNVDVTLYWSTVAPVEGNYKVFVHLLDHTGNLIAQHDGVPVNWTLPTDDWPLEDVIVDRHQITLPAGRQVSEIREISIGMYHLESLQRLDATVLDGDARSVDNSIRLWWVTP